MQKKSIFIIMISLFLVGCETIRPSYLECDNRITAIEEGSRITLRTLDNGATAQARFNGVSALCNEKDDVVNMRIKIGLKLVRDMHQNKEAVTLELPLLIAILDPQDSVKSFESVSYRMAFPEGQEIIYPVINPKIKKPKSGRVILSLSPEVIKP